MYVVDRHSLLKQSKVQDYGNTRVALSRSGVLMADLGGAEIYLENIKWKDRGITTNCVLVYDPQFQWGFVLTNSELAEKKIGPIPLRKQAQLEEDSGSEE